jgi:hypothetical protein
VPRVRAAISVAAVAGLVAVVVGGLGLADRFGGLIESDPTSGVSAAMLESVAGRVGLMTVELLFALTTSAGAALLLAAAPRNSAPAFLLAGGRLLATLVLVAAYWDRGWYYILEAGGPKVVLLLAVVQVVALAWAGVCIERAERAGLASEPPAG